MRVVGRGFGAATGEARLVLFLAGLSLFGDAVLFSVLVPLLGFYAESYDLTKGQVGALAGAFAAGSVAGSLPAGFIVSRWGGRRTLMGGLLGVALCSLVFGFGTSHAVLTATRFVQGLAGAVVWVSALTWAAGMAPPRRRAEAMGGIMAFAAVGTVLGPVVGAAAVGTSPSVVFSATAACALVIVAIVARVREPEAEPPVASPISVRAGAAARRWRSRVRQVAIASWVVVVPGVALNCFNVIVPLRLAAAGVAVGTVALVYAAAAVSDAIASPWGGRIADRTSPGLTLAGALLSMTVAVALLAAIPGERLAMVLVVVLAASLGLSWAPAMIVLRRVVLRVEFPESLAYSSFNVAWSAGAMAGAGLGGWAAQRLGDAVVLAAVAVLLALTSAFAWADRAPSQ